jgi:hypothetical protein
MKAILIILLFGAFLTAHGHSKPIEGFCAYLIGQPPAESVFVGTVPNGESAVYCMAETPEGNVLCGTRVVRGKTPWLFLFDAKNKVIRKENTWPIGKYITGQHCVSALSAAADGKIYGATTNLESIDYETEEDVLKAYEGSHLFAINADPAKFEFKDLGIPFKGEGVMAMIAGKDGKILYGITVPSQIFFSVDIASGKAEQVFKFPGIECEMNRYIGKSTKALVTDKKGNVFGSWFGGRIFKYDVKKKSMDTLKTELPTHAGTSYDCISALTRSDNGRIFGGTFLDGKLIEILPKTEIGRAHV